MASRLDFPASTSPDGFLEQLRRLSRDDGFSWLREIVHQSLDEFVRDNLPDVEMHAYPAWTIEENLDEGGRLLNNTLDLRSEILSLEAQAVQAALDLQLAMQTSVFDEQIGTLSLSAAYAQAGEVSPGGASLAESRADVLAAARLTQLTLHNQTGSALNYGQRVTFLRGLYLDNIRMAYERMYSIWLGHRSAFGENLGPPPTWSGHFDSLSRLVHWMRNAAYRTTRSQGYERRAEVLISVRSKFYQGIDRGYIDFTQKLWADDDVEFEFDVTARDLGVDQRDRVRVIGVGAALGYHPFTPQLYDNITSSPEERAKSSYIKDGLASLQHGIGASFRIGFPAQKSDLRDIPGADQDWAIPPLTLSGVGGLVGGPPEETLKIVQERQFVNAQAIGKWKVRVGRWVQVHGEWCPRMGITAGFPVPESLWHHIKAQDIVLGLRIAVMPG